VKLGLSREYHWLKILEKRKKVTELEKIEQSRAQ
jgi:hypothetical protein